MSDSAKTVAYFSMEIGIEPSMPTYSGGLGILAGDTIRSAADLAVPMVGVTLLHRKGYFFQMLDSAGRQMERPVVWTPSDFLQEQSARVTVKIEERDVNLRAWKLMVAGNGGFAVPVYFLDADLPENGEWDRSLTDFLYGGDHRYRLAQEVILGIGGVRMLRALGYDRFLRYHMNEGHAGLLSLELLDESARQAKRSGITQEDIETVRHQCVFTTHTPVPAGHDIFPMDLVRQVMGMHEVHSMKDVFCCDGMLNLTYLALNLSHYVNGVAKKHGEVSRHMFASYVIDAITNGVHVETWLAEPFRALFDIYVPGWREDNFSLRYALSIPHDQIWQTHLKAKRALLVRVNRETNEGLESNVFTVGFARRAAAYKRADLLLTDLDRLKAIAARVGMFQVIFAGKAHPQDERGKELIQRVFHAAEALRGQLKIVYLANYDMDLARLLTGGVDLWLNTPEPPMEASGTSGMKAALNGIPSLSILDGWWIEGHIEGVTGWSIGEEVRGSAEPRSTAQDAASLYDKLERIILPMFYLDREHYLEVMRHAMALNGSFFNTQRMMLQYIRKAYFA